MEPNDVTYCSRVLPRAMRIMELLQGGATEAEIRVKHFVTPEHIRSAPDLCQAAVRFDLRLTDGAASVPVGSFVSHLGFQHACETALRRYRGLFDELELPSWELTDGRQRIKLAELKRIIRERREKAAGKRAKTKRK
jgi:hypothetical protein